MHIVLQFNFSFFFLSYSLIVVVVISRSVIDVITENPSCTGSGKSIQVCPKEITLQLVVLSVFFVQG